MLAIGIALVARPRLLLMDEPLLGLSPLLQAGLARAVRDIRVQGITILVTEQFARPIMPIIDRGYVIENGLMVLQGTRERAAVRIKKSTLVQPAKPQSTGASRAVTVRKLGPAVQRGLPGVSSKVCWPFFCPKPGFHHTSPSPSSFLHNPVPY